jgi:hypothetical protein
VPHMSMLRLASKSCCSDRKKNSSFCVHLTNCSQKKISKWKWNRLQSSMRYACTFLTFTHACFAVDQRLSLSCTVLIIYAHQVQILMAISAKQAEKAREQKKRQLAFEPGQSRKFQEGCEHGQVRGAMLALLKGPDTQRRRDLSKMFLAGCSAAVNRDESIQQDLVTVAKDVSASKYIRSRSLHSLLGSLRCPTESTVSILHQSDSLWLFVPVCLPSCCV